MTLKELNVLLKQKGLTASRRREIRKFRRSKVKHEDDLRSQIEELKRLGHLQKLRIDEEIRKSFELKQKLEALEQEDNLTINLHVDCNSADHAQDHDGGEEENV